MNGMKESSHASAKQPQKIKKYLQAAEVKAINATYRKTIKFTVYTSLEVGEDLHTTIKIFQLAKVNFVRLVKA